MYKPREGYIMINNFYCIVIPTLVSDLFLICIYVRNLKLNGMDSYPICLMSVKLLGRGYHPQSCLVSILMNCYLKRNGTGHHFCGASLYGLKEMIKICEAYSLENKILFNGTKSKLLIFGRIHANPNIVVNRNTAAYL